MKKTIIFMLLVALMLSQFAFAVSDSADEDDGSIDSETNELYLGKLSEQTGILLEDDEPSRGLPFTMSALEVYTLLTTYGVSGKSFTGGEFDGFTGEGLQITGTLYHSLGWNMKYGACDYNPNTDTFTSVKNMYSFSGEYIDSFIPKLEGMYLLFSNYITYYGHITNHNHVGYVYGDLTFSKSAAA